MTEIREGDVVLIGYDYPTTREQVDRMRRELEEWFPGVEFRFICGTVQAVMRAEPIDEGEPWEYDPARYAALHHTHGPDLPRRIGGRHVEDVPLPDPFKPREDQPPNMCPHGRSLASRRVQPCPPGFPSCKVPEA